MYFLTMIQTTADVAAQTAVTAAANATDNPSATLALAVIVPFLMQLLKNASWFPLLTRHTGYLNFAVGVVAAAAATFGINATWDPVAGGTITIPGFNGLWQGVVQFSAQHAVYKGLVVPAETLGEMRTMLERVMTPPPVSEGAAKAKEDPPPPIRSVPHV